MQVITDESSHDIIESYTIHSLSATMNVNWGKNGGSTVYVSRQKTEEKNSVRASKNLEALDIVHSLIRLVSDDKIYVVICAFNEKWKTRARERRFFLLLKVKRESEAHERSHISELTRHEKDFRRRKSFEFSASKFARKIENFDVKSCRSRNGHRASCNLKMSQHAIIFFPKTQPSSLFRSGPLSFLCIHTRIAFIAFSFSCPFLILLELNLFFFLLFFPGERRHRETFLKIGFVFLVLFCGDEITSRRLSHRKVLETENKKLSSRNFESWAFAG